MCLRTSFLRPLYPIITNFLEIHNTFFYIHNTCIYDVKNKNVFGANIFDESFFIFGFMKIPFLDLLLRINVVDLLFKSFSLCRRNYVCHLIVLDNASITKSYPFVKIIAKRSIILLTSWLRG